MADATILSPNNPAPITFAEAANTIADSQSSAILVEATDGNDYIKVNTTGDAEAVTLVGSGVGRVAVGPAVPVELLHLSKSGTEDNTFIKFTSGDTGHSASDGAHVGLSETGTFQIRMDDANDILLMQGAAPRLTVNGSGTTTLSPAAGNDGLIVSSGDVGIGTTDPGYPLAVHGTGSEAGGDILEIRSTGTDLASGIAIRSDTGNPRIRFQLAASSKFVMGIDADDSQDFKIGKDNTLGTKDYFTISRGTDTVTIPGGEFHVTGGNVGIGTDDPQKLFHTKRTDGSAHDGMILGQFESTVGTTNVLIKGEGTETAVAYGMGRWGGGMVFQNTNDTVGNFTGFQNLNADGYGNAGIIFVNKVHGTSETEGEIVFMTRDGVGGGFTEVGRWDEDGNLGCGVTNPAHALDVSGTAGLSTGTAWTDTSDIRIKRNIETIDNALDKIEALRPVSFEYTQEYIDCTKGLISGKRYNSFIAQEYAQVFPGAVSSRGDLIKESPDEDPVLLLEELQQYTPHDLHMYLVRAVQELSAQVKALKEGN